MYFIIEYMNIDLKQILKIISEIVIFMLIFWLTDEYLIPYLWQLQYSINPSNYPEIINSNRRTFLDYLLLGVLIKFAYVFVDFLTKKISLFKNSNQ